MKIPCPADGFDLVCGYLDDGDEAQAFNLHPTKTPLSCESMRGRRWLRQGQLVRLASGQTLREASQGGATD